MVCGDPQSSLVRLAAARKEAETVAALYPRSDLLLGPQATKRQFMERFGAFDIVHFAGHAQANALYPELSYLMFASDASSESGLLLPDDVNGLTASRTRVLVLAGCDTGTGRTRQGEGVMSLARAFIDRGTPSVIAALWAVDDEESSVLLSELHRALRKGADAPDALRRAQLEVLRRSGDLGSAAAFFALGGASAVINPNN
jgi:CHAT domain-containing protein